MTTEQERAEVNKSIAEEFAKSMSGTELPPDKIDAAVQALTAAPAASYPANGAWIAAFFYFRITINLGNKQFVGNAGGIGGVGGGGMWGDVYTDDLDRLYRTTSAFQFNATPVYFNVNFFDAHSNFLGHFQAGALSVAAGTGGGSGGWS